MSTFLVEVRGFSGRGVAIGELNCDMQNAWCLPTIPIRHIIYIDVFLNTTALHNFVGYYIMLFDLSSERSKFVLRVRCVSLDMTQVDEVILVLLS